MNGGRAAVTVFGELLLRLDTKGFRRFRQAEAFTARYTGAEANTALCLAGLGVEARIVSRVPAHDIGQACIDALRRYGADTRHVLRGGDRLGLLYVEPGAGQRASRVVYDRAGSAFSGIDPAEIDWRAALDGADFLHVSGTAPALGEGPLGALRDGLRTARGAGVRVSFDCNWRAALWSRERMREVVSGLLPSVDLFLGSFEDASLLCGAEPAGAGPEAPALRRAEALGALLGERFGIRRAAFSVREGDATSFARFTGYLAEGGKAYASPTQETAVVDRIGGGDAFAAGLLFGLLEAMGPEGTVRFAAAAASLKNTVPGDFLIARREEIERAARGESGGVLR